MHFYCPVGSFIKLCVGPVALFNGVSSSSVDVYRGVVR